jgi:hypothetical protein
MFFLWVIIVHATRCAADPNNGNQWTSLFVALAMCGGGLVVAGLGRAAHRSADLESSVEKAAAR